MMTRRPPPQQVAKKHQLFIFIKENTTSARYLRDFVSKNIDTISRIIHVKFVAISADNAKIIKTRYGVNHVPCAICITLNKKINDVNEIVKFLTPPAKRKDSPSIGNISLDEQLEKYYMGVLDDTDDKRDDDPDRRTEEIQERMREFSARQKKVYKEIDENINSKRAKKPKIFDQSDTGESFMALGNIPKDTPFVDGMTDIDDASNELEEYLLQESRKTGI